MPYYRWRKRAQVLSRHSGGLVVQRLKGHFLDATTEFPEPLDFLAPLATFVRDR